MDRPAWTRASGHREFLRTYKACISCRLRKAKCELGGNPEKGIQPGPPCMRCRREQRNCQFTETRAWARKKKNGVDTQEAADDRPFEMQPGRIQDERHTTSAPRSIPTHGHYFPHPPHSANDDMDMSPSPHQLSNISSDFTPRSHESNTGVASPSVNGAPGTDNASPLASTTQDRSPDANTEQKDSKGLANSVMRPVVSSGNDALNILFQAAAQEQASNMNDLTTARRETTNHDGSKMQSETQPYGDTASVGSFSTASGNFSLSTVEPEVLSIWDACRFVQMGWFSSKEAVTYIDLFFKNMAPLSPIISNFYAHHRNHYWLITQEPMLCCTILMISSRYHVLPGVGGASRGYFIHQSLWQHCQQFIMRVMLGQEKGSKTKTRTIGTIEALLLMSEWHPRSLHFPPQSDGWDSDLILTVSDGKQNLNLNDSAASSPNNWLEDVIEPARRSDRMSWMLLGSGLTLAHELGVFDTDESRAKSLISCPEIDGKTIDVNIRRQRVQQLLYVFINQLASRLGCMSLMPQGLNHSVLAPLSQQSYAGVDEWSSFMTSWIELTKLVKSVTDMFFPSATFTRHQLHSGRYIGLLDHFRPLLSQWRQKYLDTQHLSSPFRDMIFIEYQYARVYTNSIGMQAVVEHVLAESDPESVVDDIRHTNLDKIDYEFIQEVIDGSCHILQKVTELAETGALRFSPVRIFLRITSSSIFLIKALSLGVRNAKLQECLEILSRSIQALRSSSLDDIHLASRYATLLEVLVSRLRRSFVLNNKPSKVSSGPTRTSSARPQPGPGGMQDESQQAANTHTHPHSSAAAAVAAPAAATAGDGLNTTTLETASNHSNSTVFDDPVLALHEINADDWLSLPFDPSMAPFGAGGNQAWSGAAEGVNLDFIWNLAS